MKLFVRLTKGLSLLRLNSMFSILRHLYLISNSKSKTDEIMRELMEIEGPITYLEIGVEKGSNLIALAKANKNSFFIGVDPYSEKSVNVKGEKVKNRTSTQYNDTYSVFTEKSSKIPNVKLIKEYSFNAVKNFKDEELDFVFIDGAHDYSSVVNDIISWLPKVKPGGILAGHDYSLAFFGVIRAVHDTLGEDNVSIRSDDTWFYFKD
jgi:hypothetical protein